MAAYPLAPQASGPSSRVELRISCKNLRYSDVLSKSDPVVAVYTCDRPGAYMEYARTEQIKNNQNPQFVKAVEMTYQFEVIQKLRFAVYDVDNDSASLSDDDFLGSMDCTLAEIVSARTYTKPLEIAGSTEGNGTITVNRVKFTSRHE
jgi:Ca2+-dependent lipid-binding protein